MQVVSALSVSWASSWLWL